MSTQHIVVVFVVNLSLALLVGCLWHFQHQDYAVAISLLLLLNQTDRIISIMRELHRKQMI